MFNSSQLADPRLHIDAVNDGRHKLSTKPHARESIPYILVLPDEGIALFTYTWVNRDSTAGAACAIFGPGVGAQPIQLRLADRSVPAGMDFNDWNIDGLSMKHDLRFEHAKVVWHSDLMNLEFTFDALHPPYHYGSHPRGCPGYAADNRTEQAGRVKGSLKLKDKIVTFDTTGHRDHSWGTRDWLAMQHYEWFVGQVGTDVAVHFWRFQALGHIEVRGFVFKDGIMAGVASLELTVDFNEQYWQKSYVAKITDDAHRVTVINTQVYGHYALIPDPAYELREGAGRATIDGKAGVGWLEVAWPKAYLDHIRQNGPYT